MNFRGPCELSLSRIVFRDTRTREKDVFFLNFIYRVLKDTQKRRRWQACSIAIMIGVFIAKKLWKTLSCRLIADIWPRIFDKRRRVFLINLRSLIDEAEARWSDVHERMSRSRGNRCTCQANKRLLVTNLWLTTSTHQRQVMPELLRTHASFSGKNELLVQRFGVVW